LSEPIGYIVGESEPNSFMFVVDPKNIPPILEYVCVYVEEEVEGERLKIPVLAQIQRIIQSNPLLDKNASSEAVSKIAVNFNVCHVVAQARVLGFPYRGKVYYPRYAPRPGSPVYRAPSSLLRQLYYIEPDSAIHIGYLINRPDVEVYLDVRGFGRHVAILAATGAGKSHTAGVIIEELLKKGATILAIDPHGDYSRMYERRDGGVYEFSDRITLLSVGPYQRFGKPYYIRVADLTDDEIAYMAGIPSKATNIRRVLSLAIRRAREMHKDTGSFDLDELITILEKWSEGEIEAPYSKRLSKNLKDSCFNAIKYLERLKKLRVFSVDSVPLREILKPMHLTVLNLTGVPFEAQDIVVYHILKRVFEARVNAITNSPGEKFPFPVFVIIEEAHRFAPPKRETYSASIIRTLASEGRKFGVYLVVITQRPSKIDSDILSQCQSQIVLRIVNPVDQRTISESSEAFSEPLLENLPGLNVGEAVIVGPIVKTPVIVKVRQRETKHGGMDLPIVELLRRAKEEAMRELNIDESRVHDIIVRIRKELRGELN